MIHAFVRPAVLTIVILAIVTASGLLLRSNTGSAETPQAPEADQGPHKAAEARIAAEIPERSDAAKAGETTKAGEPAAARQPPKVAGQALLESVGVLTAAHCYQSYLNIGLLADGRAKGIYTKKEASQLLDSVLSVLDSIDRRLAVLGKIDLGKEDHDSLEQMRDLSDLLRRQGKQLETFWDSGKDEDAAKYEDDRKDSWAAISRLTSVDR
jgi:hypothetical protein